MHHVSFNYFQELGYGVMCLLRAEGIQAAELQGMVTAMTAAGDKVNLASSERTIHSAAGRALHVLMERLRSVVTSIAAGTDTVAKAADGMAAGSGQLAERTQTQGSALTQTTDAVAQLTA